MMRAEIVLQDGYSGYEALNRFIASFAEGEGYSDLFLEQLQLTLKEAFVNAVKHGNREQNGLDVTCTFVAVAGTLLASVRDCGKGFDLDNVPNPVDPQNLFRLSGRGLYIIRSIAKSIALECGSEGSVLTLHFRPDSICSPV